MYIRGVEFCFECFLKGPLIRVCSYDYDTIPLREIEMYVYIGDFTTPHKQRSASLTNRFVFASQLANG